MCDSIRNTCSDGMARSAPLEPLPLEHFRGPPTLMGTPFLPGWLAEPVRGVTARVRDGGFWVFAIAGGLAIGIFLFDLSVPLGVGAPILYVAPVALVALWSSPKESRYVLMVASGCTLAMVVGLLLSSSSGIPLWTAVLNRAMAGVVVWITVALSLLRKRVEEEIKVLRGLLPICSFCKRIHDDHGYWKNLEAYIAAHSHADFSHGLCPDCGLRHYPEAFTKITEPEAPKAVRR